MKIHKNVLSSVRKHFKLNLFTSFYLLGVFLGKNEKFIRIYTPTRYVSLED